MVDLNTSPHSERERKVQRLYEAARQLIEAVNLDKSNSTLYQELDDAVSAFEGKAFNDVKS